MLSQLDIDRIRQAADIVDVISGYVSLRKAGASFKGLCPFHDDKTPSFSVSPAKQIYKCFSCGESGNVVHFIMKEEQLGYVEALKFLAKRYGIEIKEKEITKEEKQRQSDRESMFAVNNWACDYFHDIMANNPDGKAIGLAYFRSRGVRDDIIDKFRLGFCLNTKDSMTRAALAKGYREEFLVKTGLTSKYDDNSLHDKYRGRVVFPWFSLSGEITGFGARVLDSRTKGVSQKYINSPQSDVYDKSRQLYGLFQAKKAISKENRVFMVEGYTDVIAMHQCGIENVVANSGTALTKEQVVLLHRFTENVTLLYDGDSAGIHAAMRGTDMFLSNGMRVKVLLLPDGDDPDSFAKKHNSTEFRNFVEENQTDFITFKTNLLMKDAGSDPIAKADMIKDIETSIAVIPEEMVRSVYIHQCSGILNVREDILTRDVARIRKAERERRQREEENRNRLQSRLQAANSGNSVSGENGNPLPNAGTGGGQYGATENDPYASFDGDPYAGPDGGQNAVVNGGQNVADNNGSQNAASNNVGQNTSSASSQHAASNVVLQNEGYSGSGNPGAPYNDYNSTAGGTSDSAAGTVEGGNFSDSKNDISVSGYNSLPPYGNAPSAHTDNSRRGGSIQDSSDAIFYSLEYKLMKLIVRYGEKDVIGVDESGNEISVNLVEYISRQLEEDGLHFKTPLFANMLKMALEHVGDSNFVASTFFMYNPDIVVSRLAVEMENDKYQLSNMFIDKSEPAEADSLTGIVVHLIFDYRMAVISEELKKSKKLLENPEIVMDKDKCDEILKRYMVLKSVQQKLALQLGDRIITN